MGMGLGIEVITREWPTEELQAICSQCGSRLLLTRYVRLPGVPLPPDMAAQETEQLCGVCGTPGCEEDEGVKTIVIKNRNRDFFSCFRK